MTECFTMYAMDRVKQVLQSEGLIKNNALLFAGSLVTGLVNYAIYPALSRIVSISEFGEIQILLSLTLQLSVLSSIVRLFVVTTLSDEEDEQVAANFVRNTERTLLYISLVIAAVFALLMPFLRDFLQFESVTTFIPLAVSFIFAFLFVVRNGYFQAKQKYSIVSIQQIIQASAKFIFAIAAALLGFGVGGVIWGIALSTYLALMIIIQTSTRIFPLLKNGKKANGSKQSKASFAGKQLLKQADVLIMSGLVALSIFGLLSFDTFVVKHYYSPEEAGLYAGISVVARAIFFVTASVSGVLLSSVSIKNSKKDNIKTLLGSIGLLSLIGGVGVIAVTLFETQFVRILIGADFLVHSALLPKLCLAIFFVSILNLLLYYHLSMRDKAMAGITAIGTVVSAIWIYTHHDSFNQVADAFISASAAFLLSCIVWSVVWHIRQLQQAN